MMSDIINLLDVSNVMKEGNFVNLRELGIGKSAKVLKVGGSGALRQHFLDMGIIPGAEVTLMKYAPMGDPMELRIHGYELTLRLDDAAQIEIEEIKDKKIQKTYGRVTSYRNNGNSCVNRLWWR